MLPLSSVSVRYQGPIPCNSETTSDAFRPSCKDMNALLMKRMSRLVCLSFAADTNICRRLTRPLRAKCLCDVPLFSLHRRLTTIPAVHDTRKEDGESPSSSVTSGITRMFYHVLQSVPRITAQKYGQALILRMNGPKAVSRGSIDEPHR